MLSSDADVVQALFRVLLDRECPIDTPEGQAWVQSVNEHGFDDVLRAVLGSDEFTASCVTNSILRPFLAPPALRDEEKRFHFWHVPKTGGVSVRTLISDFYQGSCYGIGFPLGYLYRLSMERLRSIRCFAGHYGSRLEHLVPGLTWFRCTIVRNPVDHAISVYSHQRRHAFASRYVDVSPNAVLAVQLDFQAWLRSAEAQQFWGNLQSRFIALETSAQAWPPKSRPWAVEAGVPQGPAAPGDLVEALNERLLIFDLVGDLGDIEQWAETLLDAIREADPQTAASSAAVQWLNQDPHVEHFTVTDSDIDLIHEISQLDFALHMNAKTRGPSPGSQLLLNLKLL